MTEQRSGIGTRHPLALLLRAAIVATIVLAFMYAASGTRSGLTWRFVTFTYQVNVMAGVYFLAMLVMSRAGSRSGGIRGAITLYVVVAGLIWNLFLTDNSMGYTTQNVLLHVVSPALIALDWVVVGRSQAQVTWWQPVAWLAYPLIYLGGVLVYIETSGRRLYYFLDADVIGTATLLRNIVVLAVAFVALGYLLAGLGRLSVAARGLR